MDISWKSWTDFATKNQENDEMGERNDEEGKIEKANDEEEGEKMWKEKIKEK